jgi:formyl-CoA transferase
MQVFDREGVPAAPVKFPEDMAEEPQVLANDMMVELEHDLSGPQTMVAPILRMSKSPMAAQGAPTPWAGTPSYLKEAGLSEGDIADMRARGVIQ